MAKSKDAKKKRPCEETCRGYAFIGIDACQGCAG